METFEWRSFWAPSRCILPWLNPGLPLQQRTSFRSSWMLLGDKHFWSQLLILLFLFFLIFFVPEQSGTGGALFWGWWFCVFFPCLLLEIQELSTTALKAAHVRHGTFFAAATAAAAIILYCSESRWLATPKRWRKERAMIKQYMGVARWYTPPKNKHDTGHPPRCISYWNRGCSSDRRVSFQGCTYQVTLFIQMCHRLLEVFFNPIPSR